MPSSSALRRPARRCRLARPLAATLGLFLFLPGPMVVAQTARVGADITAPALTEDGGVAVGDGYVGFLLHPGRRNGAAAGDRAPEMAASSVSGVSSRQRVAYDTREPAGTVLIDTAARRLYFVEGGGWAQSYAVGVGREGFGWRGTEKVSAKRPWPEWRPPADMLTRRPDLPRHMAGGPANPLGARALYLGSTLYRIHGSNEPESVGQASSSGCFRMTNTDVIDLYARVGIGAKVVVF